MKKMLAFFSWVPGKVATGRKGGYKTRIYPAWHPTLPTNPGFAPLGALPFPQTQHLSRLAAAHEPSIYPAWQPGHEPSIYSAWRAPSPNIARKNPVPRLRGGGAPMKKMLAFFSWYPGRWPKAGRGNTNPAFIPLGCRPQTQCLPRLAAARKPSVYLAWRLPANPVFIPLGGPPTNPAFIPLGSRPRTQYLSRLAAAQEPSVYPA